MAEQPDPPSNDPHLAMNILQRHWSDLSHTLGKRPMDIASRLLQEEILVLDHIEDELTSKQDSVLTAIRKAVTATPTNLKKIANILLMFEEVVPVASQILDELDESISQGIYWEWVILSNK